MGYLALWSFLAPIGWIVLPWRDLDARIARETPNAVVRSTLLRAAAILLALATAVLLVQLGRAADPQPSAVLLTARALTIGALFHAGLFMVPRARTPWQRLSIAASMLPSAAIVVGLAGQTIARLARGAPAAGLATAIGVVGVLAYATAYWVIARRPWRDA
jgi:hypothetical protein